jgi:hypothetical protein
VSVLHTTVLEQLSCSSRTQVRRKTHQLRVAAKSLGLEIPLMGDPLYERGLTTKCMTTNIDNDTVENLPLPSSRTMLHASAIHIPSCTTMEDPISVWCNPPFFNDSTVRDDGISLSLAHDCFHSAVMRLVTKHCDIPGILDAMSFSHGESGTQHISVIQALPLIRER